MKRRIGITLRNSPATGYQENRDAIAREWYDFFTDLAWNYHWQLIPNLGEQTAEYAQAQGIEGIILSGGDDSGKDPQRDLSEQVLLAYCKENQLPLLGICRGLQMIHQFEGGELKRLDAHKHVATSHDVERASLLPWGGTDLPLRFTVNSYHRFGLELPLARGWQQLAWCHNSVEAMIAPECRWAGVMWHPERGGSSRMFDQQLCHWLFN